MAKTKKAKIGAAERRQREVIKAHAKSSVRGQFTEKLVDDEGINPAVQPKKLEQRLHTGEIKKDLIKTIIFATLVVVFLIILKTQNLELDLSIYK